MLKLFSVDDHIVEPRHVWTDRVPQRFKDLAPHVIEADGQEFWAYEDKRNGTMGLNAVAGKPPELWNADAARFADMIPGCYDPKARAQDFLSNGILASVPFPTLPRFGGALFNEFKDKALAAICVKAYNDFVLDEWCPAGPKGLYVPMIIGMLWDPNATADEIRRNALKGNRAISLVEEPAAMGLPGYHGDYWDPVWQACAETDTVVCMHIGSAGTGLIKDKLSPPTAEIALGSVYAFIASVNLMMSPVCRKFETLKIVWSEGGMGWIPAALERADRQFLRHRLWTKMDETMPSEIFKRNMYVCMIEEPICLRSNRYDVGIDRIFWECDYPHADTPWPNSQSATQALFADIPEDEVDAMTHRNAMRVFRWEMADPALAKNAQAKAV